MSLSIVSSLPPECIDIRAKASRHGFKESLLLEAYRDRKERRKHGNKIKEHIVNCESCLLWLGQQVEERFFVRARDAAEYCCLRMYMAFEETEPGKEIVKDFPMEKVRFTYFRGEDPTWIIGSKGCSIRHCPWCGIRLPNAPFRNLPPSSDWML